MYNLQRLAHRYLQIRGFTIGIGDLVRSKSTIKCEAERRAAFEEVRPWGSERRLNACRSIMGKAVIEGMDESNNFYAMVHSGSKGSLVNLTQVQACLGQMNVQGGRMPLQWREHTATHFQRGENGPLSLALHPTPFWTVCLPSDVCSQHVWQGGIDRYSH